MSKILSDKLFQTYSNKDDTLKVEVLYNNTFNYFYFNLFENGNLIQGDTKIIKNYENEFLKFDSIYEDVATFVAVQTFTLEFLK